MYLPIKILSFSALLIIFSFSSAWSQTKYEFTPGIAAGLTYDDNINLSSTNPISDYITTVSPSILLNILSEKNNLNLSYVPTFVWYGQQEERDIIRHAASMAFGSDLKQHLRFDLADTYLRSDDPIADPGDLAGDRDTRNLYQRNAFNTGLTYNFGRENMLGVGYRNNLVENEDVTLDDSRSQDPYANLTYWFGIKDGFELGYEFTDADFSRDDELIASDNFKGNTATLRYIRRFNPHTSGFLGYIFTDRNFKGLTEDYKVNEILVGFDHAFTRDMSLSLSGGYFIWKRQVSKDEDDYTYSAVFTKTFDRGSFSIGGDGGWDEDFLVRARRGFIRYWSANTGVQYQLLEKLNGSAGIVYRREKDQDNQEREIRRGTIGLGWAFLQWLTLSLDYVYADRDDDIDTLDYTNNRITLRLAAGKLYRY
jgi:hypothetical protein